MDARGFGHVPAATSQMGGTADRAARARRGGGGLTLAGLLGLAAGTYGVLDATSPPALGLPLLLGGSALAVAGLAVGGRRASRSRYRPDRWRLTEWLVAGSGVVAAVAVALTGGMDGSALHPSTSPLIVPALPVVALAGLLAALLPAWAAPAPARCGAIPAGPIASRSEVAA
jgi:energy-coupling factor transport system permease protein